MTSLYVDHHGIEMRVDGGALAFYDDSKRVGTVPLAPLERIFLRGDVHFSAGVLSKLGERDIGVIIIGGIKSEVRLLMRRLHNDTHRRLVQYRHADNADFRLHYARLLIRDKLAAQHHFLNTLRDAHPAQRHTLTQSITRLADLLEQRLPQTDNVESLRGVEGTGANAYFTGLAAVLPASLNFHGRNRRPPRDPFNALISLGYTLLYSEAVLALHGAGLDPGIGFLHEPAFGRESLACDVMEPLRTTVDEFALYLLAQQILRADDFNITEAGCLLDKAGRQHFYEHYETQAAQLRHGLAAQISALGQELTGQPFDTCQITNPLAPAPLQEDDHDGSSDLL